MRSPGFFVSARETFGPVGQEGLLDKKCVSPATSMRVEPRLPASQVVPPQLSTWAECVQRSLRLSSQSILFSAYELLETARSRMAAPHCPACGNKMAKIGKTGADEARWRRASCGASSIRRIDNAAELLEALLSRPLTRRTCLAAGEPSGGRPPASGRFGRCRPRRSAPEGSSM
jgi:transposase-like protein